MVQVSIIIVSYNTKQLLYNCLKSLYEKIENISFEIIVVDNASSDKSVEMIRETFPDVFLVLNEKNLGFGTANNLGVSVAQGEYIFLLNSDTLMLKNSILNFFNFMENKKNEKVACCGGVLLGSDFNEQNSFGNFPSIIQGLFELGLKRIFRNYYLKNITLASNIYKKDATQILEVDYLSGAAIFIKRSIFDFFGGFDEDFFFYFEETELQKRFNRNGYKSFIIPNSEILHLGGMSTPGDFHLEMMEKGKITYFRKCHGDLSVVVIKTIYLVKYFLEFLKSRRYYLSFKKIKFLLNS